MLRVKLPSCLTVVLSVFLPLLLTGCATSGKEVAPLYADLPAAPAGLVSCTSAPVPALPGEKGTPLSKAQAAEALADQRSSALDKNRCAGNWQAFYGDLKTTLARGKADNVGK